MRALKTCRPLTVSRGGISILVDSSGSAADPDPHVRPGAELLAVLARRRESGQWLSSGARSWRGVLFLGASVQGKTRVLAEYLSAVRPSEPADVRRQLPGAGSLVRGALWPPGLMWRLVAGSTRCIMPGGVTVSARCSWVLPIAPQGETPILAGGEMVRPRPVVVHSGIPPPGA